jgi:murein L,D-transpeptidase YcbB/YkuD
MRKLLLATTAAALALTISGRAFAELDRAPDTATMAPARAITSEDLLFNKESGQAKPMEQAKPDQAAPAQAQPGELAKPAISAADAPVADQLRDLVEHKLHQYVPREQDRAGVLAFYKSRDFAPVWVTGGKAAPRTEQAANFLRGVSADGLDPADYPTPRFDNTDPAKLAADELAMTNSVVTFSRHASIGRVTFSRVSGAVYFDQKAPDPADVLGKLASGNDVRATLDGYNPQSDAYKALKAELAKVRAGTDAPPVADKAPAKEQKTAGKKSHHHKAAAKPHEVKSKDAKIDTIVANMERWRWMPHQLGAAYVMVNIPDFTLKVVKDGKTVWHTKIVDGKPGTHATPLLTETMKYITVNPTWNVPPSIIRNEYLPALARDPGALARIGLKISHNPDGSIRIYQPPSEKNALGRIRFNFPNRFLVYQHDTPDKNLFAKDVRAFSHGCMRVQNPDEYAEVLLGISQPEERYTAQRIKSMYGSTERTIKFKNPIPVYITYQTAFMDDAGKTQHRADIYGLDKDITNILDGDRRVADIPVPRNYSSSSKPVMASVPSRNRESSYSQGWGFDNNGYQQQNWRSAYQSRDRFGIW